MITNESKKLLQAKEQAILNDGICLSDNYINAKEKLEWKCSNSNHPSWLSSFHNIVYSKRWCPVCAIERSSQKRKNKNGLENAQQYAQEKGGSCLSTEYMGAHKKLEWKCSNSSHSSWFSCYGSTVNQKQWCPACGSESSIENRKNKNGLQQAQQHALKKGGSCLSNQYIASRSKLEWKCSNSNHSSWFATFDQVINKDSWCFVCAQERNFDRWRTEGIKNAKAYAETRGGKCLSTEFIDGKKKLEWKCSNQAHSSWFKNYHAITSKNSWCPECVNDGISEFKLRNILNYLFDTKFVKTRELEWNINPATGKLLELDGYCDNLKIAFEFQGLHHYELAFNGSEIDLDNIKQKDRIKKQNCVNNNVLLIIVNEVKKRNFNSFYNEVVKGIHKSGIKTDQNKINNIEKLRELYNLNPINNKQEVYLKEAQKHALSRNGKCLSLSYENSNVKLEWKCENPNHLPWSALFFSVVKRNAWCRQCSIEKRTKKLKTILFD